MTRLVLLLACLTFGLTAARAQTAPSPDAPVAMVADSLTVDRATGTLVARGGVEVIYDGYRLTADEIRFDDATGTLTATGPIRLITPDGPVLLASAVDLSRDLRDGLIRGARLLLNEHFQIAAAEAQRIDGRYNTLYRAVASACEICEENPVPIWQIRARRILHDEAQRQIAFEGARIDIFGVPVFYLPQFRIPDPSVDRASGVLVPQFSSSDLYGYGVKIPYFRTLGDHADVTLTPFLTSEGAAILEAEYRQRFRTGNVVLNGAWALSDRQGNALDRGFLSADGRFDVGQEFLLDVSLNTVSDPNFLREFDYSDDDRFTSYLSLNRYRERDFLEFRLEGYQSLRASDVNADIPFILPEITFRNTWTDTPLGGIVGAEANVLSLAREGGRSVVRLGAGTDWNRTWTLAHGLRLSAVGEADIDAYAVANQTAAAADTWSLRTTTTAGVTLGWPLVRDTARATHVIEPAAQLLFTAQDRDGTAPNEDSLVAEFDETNLYSTNRFPGHDRREDGLRANLGVTYTRYDLSGWTASATLGQVVRFDDITQFSTGSGLAGNRSDYLVAASLDAGGRANAIARALFDEELVFRRAELEFAADFDRFDLSGSYLFLAANPSNPNLGPVPEREEFSVEGTYRVAPNWELGAAWTYNLADTEPVYGRAGLTYGNECIVVDLSVSRRFTDPSGLPPSTEVGFQVRLAGLGAASDDRWPARRCLTTR